MSKKLTPRQAEILELVAAGLGDKEIAKRLGVSIPTVRTHLRRMFRDRGYHNRAEAAVDWAGLHSATIDETRAWQASSQTARRRAVFIALTAAVLVALIAIGVMLRPSAILDIGGKSVSVSQSPPAVVVGRPSRTPPPAVSSSAEAPPNAANTGPAVTTEAPAVPRATPAPSVTAIGIQSATGQLALVNQDRAQALLPGLQWNECLTSVATQVAKGFAQQGYVGTTNGPTLDLGCGLRSLTAAENAGYWGSVNDAQLNSMFMANPVDRTRILGDFHYVGAAWAISPQRVAYLVEEFG
jgi:DNA-binding CsgD family transcriptional regulator/uncharacterized protein YkwD